MPLFKLLTRYLTLRLQGTVVSAVAPVGPYVKSLATGLAFIILSVLALGFALLFLALCLFFYFANDPQFLTGAVWTFIILLLLGGILFGVGQAQLKRPFRGE